MMHNNNENQVYSVKLCLYGENKYELSYGQSNIIEAMSFARTFDDCPFVNEVTVYDNIRNEVIYHSNGIVQ